MLLVEYKQIAQINNRVLLTDKPSAIRPVVGVVAKDQHLMIKRVEIVAALRIGVDARLVEAKRRQRGVNRNCDWRVRKRLLQLRHAGDVDVAFDGNAARQVVRIAPAVLRQIRIADLERGAALLHQVLVGARGKAAVARLRRDHAPRTVDNLLLADVNHHAGLGGVRAAQRFARAKRPARSASTL